MEMRSIEEARAISVAKNQRNDAEPPMTKEGNAELLIRFMRIRPYPYSAVSELFPNPIDIN